MEEIGRLSCQSTVPSLTMTACCPVKVGLSQPLDMMWQTREAVHGY